MKNNLGGLSSLPSFLELPAFMMVFLGRGFSLPAAAPPANSHAAPVNLRPDARGKEYTETCECTMSGTAL
jgi:hypothetical protein